MLMPLPFHVTFIREFASVMKFIVAFFLVLLTVHGLLKPEEADTLLHVAREKCAGKASDILQAQKIYSHLIQHAEGNPYVCALYELAIIIENNADRKSEEKMYDISFELLTMAADEGHPEAQHELAAAYNTGIYSGLVPIDPGRALLLEYMSSLSGNPQAHMGMAYKYASGAGGVKNSCDRALVHYEYAANEAIYEISKRGLLTMSFIEGDGWRIEKSRGKHPHADRASLPEGMPLYVEWHKLSKERGKSQEFTPEVIEFYKKLARDEGDVGAAYNLGVVLLHGTRLVESDVRQALYYLAQAATTTGSSMDALLEDEELSEEEEKIIEQLFGSEKKMVTPEAEVLADLYKHIDKTSPFGRAVDNKVVTQARGMLGYVLARYNLVATADVHSFVHSRVRRDERNVLLIDNESGDHVYTLDYSDMITLLIYAASKGDTNGIAGLAFLYMNGAMPLRLRDYKTPVLFSSHGVHLDGIDSRVEQNTTRALEMFSGISGKHTEAGYFAGEILTKQIKMIEILKSSESQNAAKGPQKRKKQVTTTTKSTELSTQESSINAHALVDHLVLIEMDSINEEQIVTEEDRLEERELSRIERQLLAEDSLELRTPRKYRNLWSRYAGSEFKKNSNSSRSSYVGDVPPDVSGSQGKVVKKLLTKMQQYRVHPSSESIASAALAQYIQSSQLGSIYATHRLGHMVARGIGTPSNCATAVQAFKSVAERGDWNFELLLAYQHFDNGNLNAALRIFNKFALMGYEVAQSNAAYIISQLYCPAWLAPNPASLEPSGVDIPAGYTVRNSRASGHPSVAVIPDTNWNLQQTEHVQRRELLMNEYQKHPSIVDGNLDTNIGFRMMVGLISGTKTVALSASNLTMSSERVYCKADCEVRAMGLYAQSALIHSSSDAYNKLGDMFYYGLGWLVPDSFAALEFYKIASSLKSTSATFSLGLMHEFGEGVAKQDFMLAKRFYDSAAHNDDGAKVPSLLANKMLEFHQFLHQILGPEQAEQCIRVALQKYRDSLQWSRWIVSGVMGYFAASKSYLRVNFIGWIRSMVMLIMGKVFSILPEAVSEGIVGVCLVLNDWLFRAEQAYNSSNISTFLYEEIFGSGEIARNKSFVDFEVVAVIGLISLIVLLNWTIRNRQRAARHN